MKSFLSIHTDKLALLLLSLMLVLAINSYYGFLTTINTVTWIDIFGEGSTLIMALMFMLFVLNSRPRGRVTNFLFFGFLCFCLAMWQDLIDEVIHLNDDYWFDDLIESVIAPIGILALGLGIYHWDQEQQQLNQRLQVRERYYREHSALDTVTDLYTTSYMEQQLGREINLIESRPPQKNSASLLMIDIDNFDAFNRRYGAAEGDRVLKQLAEIMVMNLRSGDLACRYAGDRFVSLLPNTSSAQAQVIALELEGALQSLAFKVCGRAQSEYLQVTSAWIAHQPQQSSQRWLEQLSRQLQHNKSLKRSQAYNPEASDTRFNKARVNDTGDLGLATTLAGH